MPISFSVKLSALGLLIACLLSGCSRPSVSSVPEPLAVDRRIAARELPPRLLESYKRAMPEHEDDDGTTGYRAGHLDTTILVHNSSVGEVFVDGGGGGHAWAESCAALEEFVRRNGWRDATSCLDGTQGS